MKILANGRQNRSTKPTTRFQPASKAVPESQYTLSAFETSLGWMGLLGLNDELVSVFTGHSSARSVDTAAAKVGARIRSQDWNPSVREKLEAYADGESVDFLDVELRLPEMTPFRHLIISATRQVGYGETTTYGELAARIGHAGAARAVGTVMSSNRFPIIVPCHRVLAAGGNIGGYTSPAGIELKRQMLQMEGQHVSASPRRTKNQRVSFR